MSDLLLKITADLAISFARPTDRAEVIVYYFSQLLCADHVKGVKVYGN